MSDKPYGSEKALVKFGSHEKFENLTNADIMRECFEILHRHRPSILNESPKERAERHAREEAAEAAKKAAIAAIPLSPCPFCGGEAHFWTDFGHDGDEWAMLTCGGCDIDVRGDYDRLEDYQKLAVQWNRRKVAV